MHFCSNPCLHDIHKYTDIRGFDPLWYASEYRGQTKLAFWMAKYPIYLIARGLPSLALWNCEMAVKFGQ